MRRVVAFPEWQALVVATDPTPHERRVNVRIVRATSLAGGRGTDCPAAMNEEISMCIDL
jgi:hypothetical protein